MPVYIALIRAIGPVTHAKMSMATLRTRCEDAGLDDVRTYITTGNIVFTTRKSAAAAQRIVQDAVASFGLDNSVIVRTATDLAALVAASPFPDAAEHRASELAVCFFATPPASRKPLEELDLPEKMAFVGGDLVVDYRTKISVSKLSPGLIEKRLGVVATSRNWNSVVKLAEIAAALKP
jgi:uncharacterized protein (DUF1697 family)